MDSIRVTTINNQTETFHWEQNNLQGLCFFLSQRFKSKLKISIFFFITVNKNFEANAMNITMAVTFNSLVLIVNVFVLFWARVR